MSKTTIEISNDGSLEWAKFVEGSEGDTGKFVKIRTNGKEIILMGTKEYSHTDRAGYGDAVYSGAIKIISLDSDTGEKR